MLKIKLLFMNEDIREETLKTLISQDMFDEIQIFRYSQIINFPWKTSVNLLKKVDDANFMYFIQKKLKVVTKIINKSITTNDLDINLILKDTCNQKDLLQGFCIHSMYKWNNSVEGKERQTNMMNHFKMEQELGWYKSYHFNTVEHGTFSDENIDFVFESTNRTDTEVMNVFNSESLQKMRKHSETFLNTNTRMLAKGTFKTFRRG